jgi:hypothetical protein
MCVPHRMRQYPNANSEDVREERDSEEGCNSRGEDGWCEPRGLPMELHVRETIKKHSRTTTSDVRRRRPLRRKFLLRRPVFGLAYRANVLQVNILINLQLNYSGQPMCFVVFVCTCMPAGASLNRHDPHTHTPPKHAHSARLVRQGHVPGPLTSGPAAPCCCTLFPFPKVNPVSVHTAV